MGARRGRTIMVMGLAAVVTVMAGCGGGGDAGADAAVTEAPTATEAPAAETEAPVETEAPAQIEAEGPAVAADVLGGASVPADLDRGVLLNLSGAQQIKLATLKVEVAADGFSAAVSRTNTIVTTAGGYIESSTSDQPTDDEDRPASGTLTVRVPRERFDDVLQQLAGLGSVLEQGFSGQDVSDQMVDLSARIETLLAQEASYREILDQATSVADILSLQQPLFDVRTQIEQLTAQKAALAEQVAYSTITFTLTEPDAPAVEPAPEEPQPGRLTEAWDTAKDGFLAVIGAMLITAIVASPFVAVGLVLALVTFPLWRRLLPGRRRARGAAVTSV